MAAADAIIDAYRKGFRGYEPDPKADDAFAAHLRDVGGYANAGDACDDYGLTGTGAGRLSLTYVPALELFPDCLPGGAQGRGSCVAWSTRNTALVSYCAYLRYGTNDERFAIPDVSPTGIANGVFSTEGIYWHRRKASDGWQCSSAAKVATSECGLLIRKAYPELGLDLTKYSAATEGRWGASLPPENIRAECSKHLCRDATVADRWESVRDLLANGFALSTCGSEAFVSTRDEWGVCARNRLDVWYHAMAAVAADDRPETVAKYGCGLVLLANSWGDYLRGQDIVYGTNIKIPVGSFWCRWLDIKDRYFVALGPAKGWAGKPLPDWGLRGII